MATIWRTENFSRGLHTKPARAGSSETYAADIENLQVDGDGFLRLRPNFRTVGPGGANITGVAASEKHLFILRDDGKLYIREIADLDSETEVPGAENMSGRLSVVSRFGNYAIITSEGTDQGYWVDLRDGKGRMARPLGLDKPSSDDFSITKYPAQSVVDADDEVTLKGPTFFVAYTISYVREFEVQAGLSGNDQLFNGMESEYAEPQGFIFKRLDIDKDLRDERYTNPASVYQMASFDFSPIVTSTTTLPSTLWRRFTGAGDGDDVDNMQTMVEWSGGGGGVAFGYTASEDNSNFIASLVALKSGEKIVCRPTTGSDVVISLNAAAAVVQVPDRSGGGRLGISGGNMTQSGTFVSDLVYALYPANADGTIKGQKTKFGSNLPEYITGVNIYRSVAIRDNYDGSSFDQITDLFRNHPDNLDLSTLLYRKIAYIPKENLHHNFCDGIFAVKGENKDQRLNAGDPSRAITGYRTYFHTLPFAPTGLGGVLIDVPPSTGIKTDYPWYDDVLMALGLERIGINVTIYGDAPPVQISTERGSVPVAFEAGDVHFYSWENQEAITSFFQNARLPSSVSQIHYYAGRIFAPVGDRLIYSDFDGTISKIWAFPKKNEIRRTRPGRVDFCASHREVLLFGGHDGLYRLTGVDPSDFDSDEISGVGPLDGYSWGTFKNSLGFVGIRGLYLTDASSVELLNEKALDGFFDAKIVQDGAVLFFEDDTMLFFVRLQSVGDEETTDSFFLFDDQHWVRWAGETATQFASNAGRFYVAGNSKLKQIQWRAGENTDADLPWVWESNLIHGQAQGAGNLTKRFAELLLSAAEGIDVTLKTWVDTQGEPTEREFTTRDDLYFQRIPIERIGKRLRFRLEGTGPVTIRGLQIEAEV